MCINQFNKPSFPRRRESSCIKNRLDSRLHPQGVRRGCKGLKPQQHTLRGNDENALSPFTLYPSRQRGASLVELVMFIIIISVAVVGVLLVMNLTTAHSADPLVRKQALAIAESLLEEIELMPFTYCDPNDANAASAVSAADCTPGLSQNVITGPTPGSETRYDAANPFDNVADYSIFNMPAPPGIFSMSDGITSIAGLDNYSANVSIARAGFDLLGVADNGAALRITVTVDRSGCDPHPCITLDGYRTRYAPNNLP